MMHVTRAQHGTKSRIRLRPGIIVWFTLFQKPSVTKEVAVAFFYHRSGFSASMAPTTMESVKTGFKRRSIAHKGESRKRAKVMHHSADTLSWKSVFRPHEAGMGGDDGILDLEEVDDVEVVYEDTEHGRVVLFKVSSACLVMQQE